MSLLGRSLFNKALILNQKQHCQRYMSNCKYTPAYIQANYFTWLDLVTVKVRIDLLGPLRQMILGDAMLTSD